VNEGKDGERGERWGPKLGEGPASKASLTYGPERLRAGERWPVPLEGAAGTGEGVDASREVLERPDVPEAASWLPFS
jgi:hypothetical protein